jgi:hypothetical protein
MNREFDHSDNNNQRDLYPDGKLKLLNFNVAHKTVDLPLYIDTGDPSTSRSLRSKGKQKATYEDLQGMSS